MGGCLGKGDGREERICWKVCLMFRVWGVRVVGVRILMTKLGREGIIGGRKKSFTWVKRRAGFLLLPVLLRHEGIVYGG